MNYTCEKRNKQCEGTTLLLSLHLTSWYWRLFLVATTRLPLMLGVLLSIGYLFLAFPHGMFPSSQPTSWTDKEVMHVSLEQLLGPPYVATYSNTPQHVLSSCPYRSIKWFLPISHDGYPRFKTDKRLRIPWGFPSMWTPDDMPRKPSGTIKIENCRRQADKFIALPLSREDLSEWTLHVLNTLEPEMIHI